MFELVFLCEVAHTNAMKYSKDRFFWMSHDGRFQGQIILNIAAKKLYNFAGQLSDGKGRVFCLKVAHCSAKKLFF